MSADWLIEVEDMDDGEEPEEQVCKYCGQLYPREKFYGGCPSCGAPHE